MHPMFLALAEIEIARRQDEIRHDRTPVPRRARPRPARRPRRLRPSLRLVRG
ncbi:MAG TPA: hypothetical protein VF288_00840 [Mycobacteriales bacterium]